MQYPQEIDYQNLEPNELSDTQVSQVNHPVSKVESMSETLASKERKKSIENCCSRRCYNSKANESKYEHTLMQMPICGIRFFDARGKGSREGCSSSLRSSSLRSSSHHLSAFLELRLISISTVLGDATGSEGSFLIVCDER
jgi:hypothetical protein